MNALNLCNNCDSPITQPNPGGYCNDCQKETTWDEGLVELVTETLSLYQGSTREMFQLAARAVLTSLDEAGLLDADSLKAS